MSITNASTVVKKKIEIILEKRDNYVSGTCNHSIASQKVTELELNCFDEKWKHLRNIESKPRFPN